MTIVRIIEHPRPVVIVRGDADEVVKVQAAPLPAVVKVSTIGTQGPTGRAGEVGPVGPQGGPGPKQVFVQPTRPIEAGPWVWWITNTQGDIINLIINDGEA